ncbi:MAG: ArnT family glycosyltransferase [Terracidiphilus sp.]
MEATSPSPWKTRRRILARAAPGLFVYLALNAGLALRLWMLKKYFLVNGDSLIYGDMAKNLLLHGQYALTGVAGKLNPTLIRLPGYPVFLALCFRVFGLENYASAAWVQIALELVGCLLLADFAGRIAPVALHGFSGGAGFSRGAAHATLWLAALCPFTAIYAAEPMPEALTLFMIALALWSAARFRERPAWGTALCFTFAVTYAALLRPDGALVAVALVPALVIGLGRGEGKQAAGKTPRLAHIALVCALLALAPFTAWTLRNWQDFHLFQPLAPHYANDPGQETYPGWQRWVKSWSLDFVSTYEVYWEVPGAPLDLAKLPSRAFDSPAQYEETAALASDYNDRDNAKDIVPDVDARFGQLADERIAAHPLRYYLWLPLGRVADMWLRPRVENMNIDLDWWVYAHHRAETRFSWAYAGLNALYLLLALAGLGLRPRFWPWMVAYMVMRSALLMTVEAPEARYTLECFPMLFALGGIAVCASLTGRHPRRRRSGY